MPPTPEDLRQLIEQEQRVLSDIDMMRRTWPEARQRLAEDPALAVLAGDSTPDRFLACALLDVGVVPEAVASLYVAIVRQAAESWIARAQRLLEGATEDATFTGAC